MYGCVLSPATIDVPFSRCAPSPGPGGRKSANAVTGNVLAKLLGTCATDSLRDLGDRGVLMVAFASGGRRRSEITGLRCEHLSVEPPIEVLDGLLLPSLAIHLGRTRTSSGEQADVVYLTGRSVEALNAWLQAAKIDKGSVFRAIGRWGTVSRRALDPQSVNAILKQRAEMGGVEREEFRHTCCDQVTKPPIGAFHSPKRWSNRGIDPFSKPLAIITVLQGGAGGSRGFSDARASP